MVARIEMGRARVRTDITGVTTITNVFNGQYRSVNYTPEERRELIKAL